MASIIERTSCGICQGQVGEDAILCGTCSQAHHPSPQCTGLKELTLQCLREEAGAIQFKCTSCRCAITGNSDRDGAGPNGEWKAAVGQVLEIVKALAGNMNQMSLQMSTILEERRAVPPIQQTTPTAVVSNEAPMSRKDLFAEMGVRGA